MNPTGLTSDSSPELTDPSKIVVIHPGSLYLRLGLASESTPQETLHCVARKRRFGHHRDSVIVSESRHSRENVREARLQISSTLANSLKSDGSRRVSSTTKFGKPEILKGFSPIEEEGDASVDDEIVIGDRVLNLLSSDSYNIHFPFQRGDLRERPGVIGGSHSSLLVDVQTIWTKAIVEILGIPVELFPSYKAVLVIPALYQRPLLKKLLRVLLLEMEFGAAFLLQDHVAATFGSGLSAACVVDAGDQKISVSCVEDGISHPNTRIQLNYGGGDVTQIYLHLLKELGFPYDRCNPEVNISDALIVNELKKDHCHLNLDICGLVEKKFIIGRNREELRASYTVYVGDEAVIAPAALFFTELLELTGSGNRVQLFTPDPGDSEDPHDLLYLNDTSRKYTKAGDPTGDMDVSQTLDEDLDIVLDNNANGSSTAVTSDNVISLDQAILKSIEACPSDDLKRKMYGCILIVGGGLKFEKITQFLRQKLVLQIPSTYRSDPMEIIIDAKDISAEKTTWKGAAILACLESAQELWIKPREFAKHGQKLLRERAPFPWA